MIQVKLEEQSIDKDEVIGIGPIELHLQIGDVATILGPSGAGKTSLLESIAQINPNLETQVSIHSTITENPSREIQIVFQNDRIPEWLKVNEALRMVLPSRIDKTKGHKIIQELLDIFELQGQSKSWVSQLSGGELSRLGLARVFVDPPKLLLMDEPFRNIDHIQRERISKWVFKKIESSKITTVIVSHSLKDALYFGNKIYITSSRPMKIIETKTVPENIRGIRYGEDVTIEMNKLMDLFHDISK